MADTEALRPLVQAALHHQAEQQHKQATDQWTPASQQASLTIFRTRLEGTLAPSVRQALDLLYEWDNWIQQPRAKFRLESLKGIVECTLYFREAHCLWAVFIPHASHLTPMCASADLEEELLVAIGEFWKGQGMPPPAASPQEP